MRVTRATAISPNMNMISNLLTPTGTLHGQMYPPHGAGLGAMLHGSGQRRKKTENRRKPGKPGTKTGDGETGRGNRGQLPVCYLFQNRGQLPVCYLFRGRPLARFIHEHGSMSGNQYVSVLPDTCGRVKPGQHGRQDARFTTPTQFAYTSVNLYRRQYVSTPPALYCRLFPLLF